ncbi:MAG: hypothetical protein AAGF11_00410 [Myxococcota bacterium]
MKHIQLSVTVDEANLILEGLGQLPFVRVYELIASLQQQAKGQVGATTPTPVPTLAASGDQRSE